MDRSASIVRLAYRLAGANDALHDPDQELLRRVAGGRDDAAFKLLVNRHGPMVFGAAQRVLHDRHAAEDVYQATFLALAKNARSVRNERCPAGWLYRVAVRTALKVRRRKPSFGPAIDRPDRSPSPESALLTREVQTIVDEEIERLPERFRRVVVLCYLSGRTTDEAAQELDCPRGTVLSRLSTARETLRRRLTRRGLAISAAVWAVTFGEATAPAVAPLVSFVPAAISPAALVLSHTILRGVFMTRMTMLTCAVAASGLIGLGAARFGGPGEVAANPNPQFPSVKKSEPVAPPVREKAADPIAKVSADFVDRSLFEIDVKDSELQKLMKERANSATVELKSRWDDLVEGRGSLMALMAVGRRARDSRDQLAGAEKQLKEENLKQYVQFAKVLEKIQRERFEAGAIKQSDLELCRYERLNAEIELLQSDPAHRPALTR